MSVADESAHDVPPGRWRKKPVVVDAMQYTGPDWWAGSNYALRGQLAEFGCSSVAHFKVVGKVTHGGREQYGLFLRTLEGDMRVMSGDWIIRGVKGEFYPCKPDIFDATYEPADESTGSAPPALVWACVAQNHFHTEPPKRIRVSGPVGRDTYRYPCGNVIYSERPPEGFALAPYHTEGRDS